MDKSFDRRLEFNLCYVDVIIGQVAHNDHTMSFIPGKSTLVESSLMRGLTCANPVRHENDVTKCLKILQ